MNLFSYLFIFLPENGKVSYEKCYGVVEMTYLSKKYEIKISDSDAESIKEHMNNHDLITYEMQNMNLCDIVIKIKKLN